MGLIRPQRVLSRAQIFHPLLRSLTSSAILISRGADTVLRRVARQVQLWAAGGISRASSTVLSRRSRPTRTGLTYGVASPLWRSREVCMVNFGERDISHDRPRA